MNKHFISFIIIGIILLSAIKILPQNLSAYTESYYRSSVYVNNSIKKVKLDTTNDFPLQVGDRWTYHVIDSIKNINDTVTVKINNVKYLPNGTIRYIWLFKFTDKIDSLYLERKIDTLSFLPISLNGFYNGLSKLVLPIKVGSTWGGIGDEAGSVASIDTVIVQGGTFYNAFRIVQSGFCCNDYSRIQFWIQPGVGIVKEINSIFISEEPNSRRLENWELLSYSVSNVTGMKDDKINPIKFTLYQNYPNPFNPATTIKYDIPKAANVTLKVYDILGNEVETLVNKEQQAGSYKVQLAAGSRLLASGVYFYQLKAGNFIAAKKLLLLK